MSAATAMALCCTGCHIPSCNFRCCQPATWQRRAACRHTGTLSDHDQHAADSLRSRQRRKGCRRHSADAGTPCAGTRTHGFGETAQVSRQCVTAPCATAYSVQHLWVGSHRCLVRYRFQPLTPKTAATALHALDTFVTGIAVWKGTGIRLGPSVFGDPFCLPVLLPDQAS